MGAAADTTNCQIACPPTGAIFEDARLDFNCVAVIGNLRRFTGVLEFLALPDAKNFRRAAAGVTALFAFLALLHCVFLPLSGLVGLSRAGLLGVV